MFILNWGVVNFNDNIIYFLNFEKIEDDVWCIFNVF